MSTQYRSAIVFGGGAFGTAMASVLAENFQKVFILVRSHETKEAINQGNNGQYLPKIQLNKNIQAVLTLKDIEDANEQSSSTVDLLVSGLPSSGVSEFFRQHHAGVERWLEQGIPMVSLTKGIDPHTLELTDDILFGMFPKYKDQIAFLSGPSFAQEIMERQITLVTLASRSKKTLDLLGGMLNTSFFKVMSSYDIKGVLLGGALKNVLAIAGGILEGLGFNHNTRAAMITRGIQEMLRFGIVYNARPETFYGLSGMGDLILTTTGELSRNKSFGLELAKGHRAVELLKEKRQVVEGYKTAKAIFHLAKKYDVHAPIFIGVHDVLYDEKTPEEVIARMMKSPSKFE